MYELLEHLDMAWVPDRSMSQQADPIKLRVIDNIVTYIP
jgi:hypothetical protein